MLVTVRGVVLGFSKAWRDGKFSKFRKILIGFPDNREIPKLWCTVWGKENWGYNIVDNRPVEIIVKCGMIISVSGDLSFFNGERGMSVKSDGSMRGGFSAVGEYRKYKLVQVQPWEWSIDEHGKLDFDCKRGDQTYRGRQALPMPAMCQPDGHYTPQHEKSFALDGEPLLVDMAPDVWFFDRDAKVKVLSAPES